MGVTVTILDPAEAEPKKLNPKKGDTVEIHYVGTLDDANNTPFDSSEDRKAPFTTQIGVGKVIKGWDEGVVQLSLGQRAVLLCTPDYAYGARGFPPVIPENATLKFKVHLRKINNEVASNVPDADAELARRR